MATTYTKKELRPLLTQYGKGKITKRQAEEALGIKNARGKAITRLWESNFEVDTRFGKVVPLTV